MTSAPSSDCGTELR